MERQEVEGAQGKHGGRLEGLRSAAVISGPGVVLSGLLGACVLAAAAASWGRAGQEGRPLWRLVAVGSLVPWAWRLLLNTQALRLGATPEEVQRPLPGDELVPGRHATELTHALTLRARPEDIWPWLVQVGSDGRGGYYSHAWLERLAGGRVYNTERILPEYQHPKVGDVIAPLPEGDWRVMRVDPQRVFVFGTPDFAWGFVLEPLDEEHTRLLVRLRMDLTTLGGPLAGELFNLHRVSHLIMQRKMFQGLRRLAERTARQREAGTPRAVSPALTTPPAAPSPAV